MCRHHVVCLAKANAAVLDLDVEREILAAVPAEITIEFCDDTELPANARDADAILHRGAFLDATRIAQLRNCRLIAHAGIGFDTVDVDAATRHGILVTNVAEYCIDEVSTHALCLLLALHRRLDSYSRQTRAGHWAPQGNGTIGRLSEATLAVVGYGRIGSAVANKARQLGMRVLAVDPFIDPLVTTLDGVSFCTLHDALPQADFVSLHTPLNPGTVGLIGAMELSSMKPSAYLINTARGEIVDEQALIDALSEGRIAGAGLDVLTLEPPEPSNPLLHMSNVIVTPHAAYYSSSSVMDVRRTTATQIADVLRGYWPNYVLNPTLRDPSMPSAAR